MVPSPEGRLDGISLAASRPEAKGGHPMKSVVGAIGLAFLASIAFAQGGTGGGGTGGGGVGAPGGAAAGGGQPGLTGPAAGGSAVPASPVRGQVFAPGGTVAPIAPGIVTPGVSPSPQPGVDQPNTTQPPGAIPPPTSGTPSGTGVGNQGGPGVGSPVLPPGSVPVPPGVPTSAAAPSAATVAVQPPPPGPLVIAAPPTSETAPVGGATTRRMPADAIGVIVESMMPAEVMALDTDRSCVTVRALDGDTASYRIAPGADGALAVGEQVVLEVQRPLFASAADVPSASPRMTDSKGQARPDASIGVSSRAGVRGQSPDTRTTLSSAGRTTLVSPAGSCPPR